MNNRGILLACAIWLLVGSVTAVGQVSVGGLLDLEIRRGGSDSSPIVNQTPAPDWSLYTPYVRLFFQGDISDKWYVSAALQADHYYGRSLSNPFFSAINLNWVPNLDRSIMLTGGRFITPQAGYSDLLLSSQNAFVHLPMALSRNVNVDRFRGYYSGQTNYSGYSGTNGMSILYQRLYSQGLKLQGGSLEDDGIQYKLAATLSSPSSYFEYGEHNRPSFTASVIGQPTIWAKMGITGHFGPFMQRSTVNNHLSDEELSSYDQLAIGGFSEFSYHYFVLRLAGIWNRWHTPWIGVNGIQQSDDINATVGHWMAQLKYRFPFLVGGYIGLRFEQLIEGTLTHNTTGYGAPAGGYSLPGDWVDDTTRLETVLGYKLDRSVLLKLSYLYSHNENGDLADNVIALQLSAGF